MRRTLVAVVATIAALAAASPALADPGSWQNPSVKTRADAIMSMSYSQFDRYRRVIHDAPFDWSADGCSAPTPPSLRRLFSVPCQQHDFGYRNYGRGLRLGRNEDTRGWIDGRLLTESRRLCDASFSRLYQKANKAACRSQAYSMWVALRHGGRPAFYG